MYSPRLLLWSSHEGPLLVIRILSAGFASFFLSSGDEAPAAAEEADLVLAEDEDEAEEDITELSRDFHKKQFVHAVTVIFSCMKIGVAVRGESGG